MSNKFLILLYHGVFNDKLDLQSKNSSGKHISETEFSKQIKYLKNNFPIARLDEIGAALTGKIKLKNFSVAVTFDDGFLNNFTVAREILENYSVPTTFYLATGFISSSNLIWTDKLESIIVKDYCKKKDIYINNIGHYSLGPINKNVEVFLDIKTKLKILPDKQKHEVLNILETQLEVSNDNHDLYKFMTWDQIREMNKSDLFNFGAHTVNHISLSKVPKLTMQNEIKRSINHINKELKESCCLFSYPEGQKEDFNEDVIDYLKKINIKFCPTAIEGYNIAEKTDPYYMRRFMVGFENRPFPL